MQDLGKEWFTKQSHINHLRRSRLGLGRRLAEDFDVTFCLPPLHEEAADTLLMLPMLAALAFAIEGTHCQVKAAAAGEVIVDEAGGALGAFLSR